MRVGRWLPIWTGAVAIIAACGGKTAMHHGGAGSPASHGSGGTGTGGGSRQPGASSSKDGGGATSGSNDAAASKDAAARGTDASHASDGREGAVTAEPPPGSLPVERWPHTSRPQVIGVLVGPGAAHPQSNLTFYGTDSGVTYEHDGKQVILFGDTWTTPTFICDQPDPLNDDSMGTIPLEYPGDVPEVSFVTKSDAPNQISTTELHRGSTVLGLGSAKVAMAGFTDGQHEFAIFERYDATRCAADGPGVCPVDDGFKCTARVGECTPALGSALLQCDPQASDDCYTGVGQSCGPASPNFCFDPNSSQSDGSVRGEITAQAQNVAIGMRHAADGSLYDSIFTWQTNKFSNLTARTVKTFSGTRDGNDYSPGHDALLVWGRPGFVAEEGRQAQLYLMMHRLPLEVDGDNALHFAPQYFAGIDADTAEPKWSAAQSDAAPLPLDGIAGGDPREALPIVNQMTVSWLGDPIDKWIMMYGGDISDLLLFDPLGARSSTTPAAIVVRFADQPWGPWTPPVPHLWPGSPSHVGDPYGPGGIMFHPDCADQGAATCVASDALRPLDALLPGCPLPTMQPDLGRFYSPNIIDGYLRKTDDNGLDVFWNVSVWNPYRVMLMKTTVYPPEGPQAQDEVADQPGLERMSDWRALPLLSDSPGTYRQQTSKDRGTTDSSFPLSGNGNKDFNNFLCASADAKLDTSAQIAPFAFDAPSCQDDEVHGVVLGRFEGSGRLVRVWLGMYSLLSGPADDEIFRIYVDGDPKPTIEVPLADALSGKAGEIFAPPFGAGSPRRMAWYYPVAFHQKLVVALDGLGTYDEYYYHCDVAFDAAPASDALPHERLKQRDDALAQLNALEQPVAGLSALRSVDTIMLDAGKTQTMRTTGPETVYELSVRVPTQGLAALDDVGISVRWDDAKDAAIELGLLELFAAAKVPPERASLALRSYEYAGKRVLTLRLPMPYANSAEWAFKNNGSAAASFEFELRGEKRVPLTAFGHLHTQRNETVGPTTAQQHVAVSQEGRGRLVGVCARVEGHADPNGGIQNDPLNLLEADVRATIDGELALDGTGSEEYADDVFYFTDAPHGDAFTQAWGVNDDSTQSNAGQANFCRFHVLGTELDFNSAIDLSYELGGAGNPSVVDRVQTVAYLYLPD